MPIYEYECKSRKAACQKCVKPFEIIQGVNEKPLSQCPWCGEEVRKLISYCRAAVIETADTESKTEKQIREYEKQHMWSHAAELADKHAEKIKDEGMKMRAIDNYEKAGYDAKTLEKHAKSDNS
jgi:putative FmdB family regulatory protein